MCFRDPELQAGFPEMDKLGLPRPISGSFATVYKMKCGEKEWAVRCFTNNVKDQKIRYDAISMHLSAVKLPYMVHFEYLSEGIKINGNWYPIVKMEWVEGESLLHYIERHLHDAEILRELGNKWLKMLQELHEANIAHGDLQHGNVLIHNDEIILIDYDGMYVPDLDGMPSNELGHRNYQHPGRNPEHFGPYIDNFSAWVIFISIAAVSADASLWHSLGAGEADERLLFRQNDFVLPDASQALECLERADDEALRSLIRSFREVMSEEVTKVPRPFDPQLKADAVQLSVASVSISAATKLMASFAAAFKEWLVKKMRSPAVTIRSQPESSYSTGSSWVLDYLETEAVPSKPWSTDRFLLERTVSFLVVSIAAVAAVAYGNAPSTALLFCTALGVGEMAFLNRRYLNLSVVQEKRAVSDKIKRLEDAVSGLTIELNHINDIKLKHEQMEEEKLDDLLRRQGKVSERETNEIEEVEKKLQGHISEVLGERQTIDQEEKTELTGALAAFKKTWLDEQLMKHRISKEKFPDIDDEMKRRLGSGGIRTAADFLDITIFQSYGSKKIEKVYLVLKSGGSVHVGMSPSQAKTLVEWKKRTERKYKPKIPQALPRSEMTAITSKFTNRKSALNSAEQAYKNRAQHQISHIRQAYSPEHDFLKREEDTARMNLTNELRQFEQEITELNKHLAANQWELHDLTKRMASFKDINFLCYLRRIFLLR
ncbi:protein kinase domain-containing protein [Paenibacillus montanisoli]